MRWTGKSWLPASLCAIALLSCGGKQSPDKSPNKAQQGSSGDQGEAAPLCPAEEAAPALLPNTSEAHQSEEYWLSTLGERFDLDEILLAPEDIQTLSKSYQEERPGFFPQQNLLIPLDENEFRKKVKERFDWMQGKLDKGEYKKDPGPDLLSTVGNFSFSPTIRIALQETQLYCAPTTLGFFDSDATSRRIDRNRCSGIHAQEAFELLAPYGEMFLARSKSSWGFIAKDALLSPPLSQQEARQVLTGKQSSLNSDTEVQLPTGPLRLAALTQLTEDANTPNSYWVASAQGLSSIPLAKTRVQTTERPLTRRSVIRQALRYVGRPYGFGGLGGGIDCSRLIQDTFASFALPLPRFSGWQSKAGTHFLEVGGVPDAKKYELIDEAQKSGIVILHLPGHIMLYLGKDKAGIPMAVHALSYYLDKCEAPAESDGPKATAKVVGKVAVGDLELGRNTRKTALIERINRITVLGNKPTPAILAFSQTRHAIAPHMPDKRSCKRGDSHSLFLSPRKPRAGQSVKLVAIEKKQQGPTSIAFYDSKGKLVRPNLTRADGQPGAWIGESSELSSGNWTAVVGDDNDIRACMKFKVGRAAPPPDRSKYFPKRRKIKYTEEELAFAAADTRPIWTQRRRWNQYYENLYAIFNERLFDYENAEETWPDLHTLLRDPKRNILYDYFGKDEDHRIRLVPDCADLPYTLRAYFAWKMRLPFGTHLCRRAKENRPPKCEVAETNLLPRSELKPGDDISIFAQFVNRKVRRTVHSSSGRTAPKEDLSDFYPVPLTREALRPGTLFTDPYGHLLIVVDWVRQGATGYGELVGADAQPDGTIGRRRFWRGSFLFHPDTKSGGAGFKAFRPWLYDKESEGLITRTNKELRSKPAPYSRQQYKGSESDFYDRMESLINPRALDPRAKMRSLVDALEAQVVRRGVSVKTGEDFMASRSFAPIDMPTGSKIFLTSGPWEDFSTPSRDWRLLVAIHTVVDFPDAVKRSPEQYGFSADSLDSQITALRSALNAELASRKFSYIRSDGSSWPLSLKDLIDRRVDFEMSYNPNDCPEVRWAAPEKSEEYKSCKRRAPADQHQKMLEYRHWFSNRRRPAS